MLGFKNIAKLVSLDRKSIYVTGLLFDSSSDMGIYYYSPTYSVTTTYPGFLKSLNLSLLSMNKIKSIFSLKNPGFLRAGMHDYPFPAPSVFVRNPGYALCEGEYSFICFSKSGLKYPLDEIDTPIYGLTTWDCRLEKVDFGTYSQWVIYDVDNDILVYTASDDDEALLPQNVTTWASTSPFYDPVPSVYL
jgi:hypothetical protein